MDLGEQRGGFECQLEPELVRRGVPLKALNYGKAEQEAGSSLRQRAEIQQGIPQEKAKDIAKMIRDNKFKVQSRPEHQVMWRARGMPATVRVMPLA